MTEHVAFAVMNGLSLCLSISNVYFSFTYTVPHNSGSTNFKILHDISDSPGIVYILRWVNKVNL